MLIIISPVLISRWILSSLLSFPFEGLCDENSEMCVKLLKKRGRSVNDETAKAKNGCVVKRARWLTPKRTSFERRPSFQTNNKT